MFYVFIVMSFSGTKFPSSLKVLILDGMSIDANMLHESSKAFSSITMLDLEKSRFKGAVAAGGKFTC